jgi:hypothetical protein
MPNFLLIKQEPEYGQFFEDIDDFQTVSFKIPEIRFELNRERIKLLYFHFFYRRFFTIVVILLVQEYEHP